MTTIGFQFEKYLLNQFVKKGWVVIAHNFRISDAKCRESDLVLLKGRIIRLVEVKYRTYISSYPLLSRKDIRRMKNTKNLFKKMYPKFLIEFYLNYYIEEKAQLTSCSLSNYLKYKRKVNNL